MKPQHGARLVNRVGTIVLWGGWIFPWPLILPSLDHSCCSFPGFPTFCCCLDLLISHPGLQMPDSYITQQPEKGQIVRGRHAFQLWSYCRLFVKRQRSSLFPLDCMWNPAKYQTQSVRGMKFVPAKHVSHLCLKIERSQSMVYDQTWCPHPTSLWLHNQSPQQSLYRI